MLIAHSADIHLGVTTHGKYNVLEKINSRIVDFTKCLEFVVDTCIERKVDLFIFAGDAYKNPHPTSVIKERFERQIMRLIDHRIGVVLVPGNHDRRATQSDISTLESFNTLANLAVINEPQNIYWDTQQGGVSLTCFPWPTKALLAAQGFTEQDISKMSPAEMHINMQTAIQNKITDLANELATESDQIQQTTPHIFVGHLDVDEAQYSSEQSMIFKNNFIVEANFLRAFEDRIFKERESLAKFHYDYFALGHIHKYQHLENGEYPIVYSGSIDRIDFSEEKDPKGFCLVSIDKKNGTIVEFIKTPARSFKTIHIDLRDYSNPTEGFLTVLQNRQNEIFNAITRIYYHVTIDQPAVKFEPIHSYLQGMAYTYSIHQLKQVIDTREILEVDANTDPVDAINLFTKHHPVYQQIQKPIEDLARSYVEQLTN